MTEKTVPVKPNRPEITWPVQPTNPDMPRPNPRPGIYSSPERPNKP